MTPWFCSRCGEDQIAFGPIPADRLCHTCHDALHPIHAFTEADAGIPQRYRGLTRESWIQTFQRPWPETLESWCGDPQWIAIWGPTGTGKTGLAPAPLAAAPRPGPDAGEGWGGDPQWIAIWGPTGTGKTGLATVLLAEHLRTGRRGRWISGPELAHRLRRAFASAEDPITPLLTTALLVLDEPVAGSWDWYIERLTLITRTRYEPCLPTIVTSQPLPPPPGP